MAESTFLPPWLTRDYDPVGTFMRAYQTGAQISEAQTRLAEQQRQANMEAQARQEQLQQQALHDLVNVQVTKAYHDQQIALDQAQLAEAKKYHEDLARNALNTFERQLENNRIMQALREREVAVKEGSERLKETQGKAFSDAYNDAIAKGKTPAEASRIALSQSPALITPTTVPVFGKDSEDNVRVTYKPEGEDVSATGSAAAIEKYRKQKDAEKEAEKANRPPGALSKFLEGLNLGDVLKYKLTGQVPQLSNLPEPTVPGQQPAKSPYPEGTILRKKDGSRWIVKNGEPVPYGN